MTEDTTTRKPLRNTRENAKYKAYTTMNKLIEEAERLYKQIDELQGKLAFNLSNDDNETLIKAKCFISNIIDHKDNIVDLSEVWHDITEEPKLDSWFLGQIGKSSYDTYISAIEGKRMSEWFDGCNIKRWAYINDLLPKGGER